MRILKVKNSKDLADKAAAIIGAQVILKPDSVLGLATGSTPVETYTKLVSMCNKGELTFRDVKTVNLDEYVGLAPNSPQSYRYFMNQNLFDNIDIDKANTNVPDGLAKDVKKECARYDALIKDLGGIDLQLLGIGQNGHIGFNEPCDSFVMDTQCVELTKSTIEANSIYFDNENDMPRKALTMGMRSIMHSRRILLIAGANKKSIIEKALFGPVTPSVPASILQLHMDTIVIISEE